MNKKVLMIANEILKLEEFNLNKYYKYLNEYGKYTIFKVFLYILEKNNKSKDIYYKYFDAFFTIELDYLDIGNTTYFNLIKAYGKDRIDNYFINLLEINNYSDELKKKYEKIYSNINIQNDLDNITISDDATRDYLFSLNYPILSDEEEKGCFQIMNMCKSEVEIADLNCFSGVNFYDFDKVMRSIRTLKQLKMIYKISDSLSPDDKKIYDKYYSVLKKYFKTKELLVIENSDVYESNYFEGQLMKISAFNKIRERIINSNLKLVVSFAKKHNSSSLHLIDLIQEGNIGLMTAIEKFNVEKGYRLSTYASWWINQAIDRAVTVNDLIVRQPVHLKEKIYKINKYILNYEIMNGVSPTNDEIARDLNYTVDDVIRIKNTFNSNSFVSLDAYVGEDEKTSILDFVADETADCFTIISEKETNENLRKIINSLSSKESFVLIQRFGLDGKGERTLQEVGNELGVTRERIRQIESTGIRKLRHPSRRRILGEYY